jgi:predicted phosphodiesterase
MKISICSDIHLEFGPIELKNKDGADVLVLSGDICVSHDLYRFDETAKELGTSFAKSDAYHSFFQNCCKEFKHVVYVAGNHEHYHGDYATTLKNLKENLGYLVNLHVLDKESVILDDVPFFGGTLWTDMNKEDPVTLSHIRGMMNDFRIVANSNKQVSYKTSVQVLQAEFRTRDAKFSPEDAVEDHKAYLTQLNVFLNTFGTQKVVVVGHHAPSKQSTHPRYAKEELMNGGYSSSLENLMLDNPNIKLWTHGHTHEDFDYMIGSTRIVCNPRGYINYEHRADHFELKTVEI